MIRPRRMVWTALAVTVAVLGIVVILPRPACGCISPEMRFRQRFGRSAGDVPADVHSAILQRLPIGTSRPDVTVARASLDESTLRSASMINDKKRVCVCTFRTSVSMSGFFQRRVTLEFWVDDHDTLSSVRVERTTSWF